jgi:O-methyltransferase
MNSQLLNLLVTLRHPMRKIVLRKVYEELTRLEYHSFNRRLSAIEQCTEYLLSAQVEGDYAEFGVWQGTTFSYAYKWFGHRFNSMKFCAFDSFEGLPKPSGKDAENNYTSQFAEAQFSCSEDNFKQNIKKNGVDLSRIKIVKGWFSDTLTPKTAQSINLTKVAIAWIDCDYYNSTVPVLNFLTPFLSKGSIIIFDDWRCYKNDSELGEQKACAEWLAKNPHLKLNHLLSIGWNGIAFTVG